jgi:mono/diheme cytochrome c family protein
MKNPPVALAGMLAALAVLLAGCGQDNTGDVAATQPAVGLDLFLVFPNPQLQDDGTLQVAAQEYADAYYAAVDPANARATLAGFMALNQFDSGSGTQHLVVFRDTHDLGSGRRMTARRNTDGTLAFVVENYRVEAGPNPYSSINVDAAAARDTRWHFGTNAIEFSPLAGAPTANCANCVVKFYNYDAVTGQRQALADIDTRGPKAMPTICITCHGGRGDPLKADGNFPRSATSLTQAGNTQARLQAFNVPSFEYSAQPGFTRADQEAKFRDLNQWVLCSYPMHTWETGYNSGINACRPDANPNEWYAKPAADMIKVWYGDVPDGTAALGPTLTGSYVPAGWTGRETLWNNVVGKYCRACHILRGTINQNDIAFASFIGVFDEYKDRIKAHVFDRGNMPLSLFVYQNFWSDAAAVNALADFLEDGTTPSGVSIPVRAGGAIPSIGRPVADPGPDRRVGATATLSAASSVFATSYQWAVLPPCNAGLGVATERVTTLTWPAVNGSTCVVTLTVSNMLGQSHTKQLTLTKDSAIPAVPTFADIRGVFTHPAVVCTGCHYDVGNDPAVGGGVPPIFYTDYSRGGAMGTEGDGTYVANASDNDYWFYKELRGRVNLSDFSASPLLRKPIGHHHNAGNQLDFANPTACVPAPGFPACQPYATLGEFNHAQYSIIANWIVNGAPYQ